MQIARTDLSSHFPARVSTREMQLALSDPNLCHSRIGRFNIFPICLRNRNNNNGKRKRRNLFDESQNYRSLDREILIVIVS